MNSRNFKADLTQVFTAHQQAAICAPFEKKFTA
jgi:hypothetical protein